MEKYSLEMYNVLEKIYGWLMKDTEIFAKPEFIVRLFDEVDDLLCRIRCEIKPYRHGGKEI